MRPWTRRAVTGACVLALAGTLFTYGALAGSPDRPDDPAASGPAAGAPARDAPAGDDSVAGRLATLQASVERAPRNPGRWSELGLAYVTAARLTADPSYYARADGAFTQALRLRPTENAEALTGRATLASARHDFAEALRLADASLAFNDYSPTTYGVKTDALVELGRYDEARTAVQRMLDLSPDLAAYTRASYALELRGDVPGARRALTEAAEDALTPPDEAFAQYYLGELAWNNGDLAAARSAYESALTTAPEYVPALAGRAKVLAASGDRTAALADYREAVQRLPQASIAVELGELLQADGQEKAAQQQYDVVRATQRLFAAAGADVDQELALFEADHGTPAAAVRYAEAAYRSRPKAIFVQDAYAWALHAAGRDREALPIARQAVRLGTRTPSLYYHLGAIEAGAGNNSAAKQALNKALSLNPAFSPLHAPAAKRLLATLG